MITSKQRSYLRSLAHNIDPVVYIGKAGVTENVIKEIDQALEARELVKVKIQEGCELAAKDVANDILPQLEAEFVQAIGRKFTLYRESKENKQIELPKAKK
ncbi:MAG: ribosome assembly RNA-binding protein YhbY [Firmicutes bacterium]|nr:ribosome assembly RNA-binding protein YhbY [Bacillota bacterium]MBR3705373.1 ribosome assembly RNA-binding protein YhbY [Bacillota bacterium]